LEEQLMSNFSELFDCSVVGVQTENGETWPKIICEITESANVEALRVKVVDFLAEKGIARVAAISFDMKPHFYGVTGKVLKRVLREEA
jgi:hypothetical protein